MSARAYVFSTAAHWRQCLGQRFETRPDGTLAPIARLGARPQQESAEGPALLVAVDPYGSPYWKVVTAGRSTLWRKNDFGDVVAMGELDSVLGKSPRWIVDRLWVWGFDSDRATISRYERETLQADLTLTLDELCFTGPLAEAEHLTIVDIASDTHEGLWLLLRESDDRWWLVHFDCEGRVREVFPVPPFPMSCGTGTPFELGSVSDGETLVLLTTSGKYLFLIDVGNGAIQRTIANWDLDPCWRILRLATDARNRISLLCRNANHEERFGIFILDRQGDALDSLIGPLDTMAGRPNDVAVTRDTLWLAADSGLWRLDGSESSTARASESVLVTPVLVSPQTDTERGWLRAEFDIDLPQGVALEVDYASTNDERVANEAIRISTDRALGVAQRQQMLWEALDITRGPAVQITSPFAANEPVSVPLFATEDQWLWLRIKVVTPPGVTPPPIRRLRVSYPDSSLMRYLPSVFRGSQYDPTGAMRSLVGVLEGTTESIDDRIQSIATHLDASVATSDWLDYLARWLDLPWDDALPAAAKRRIVQNAGSLLAFRGTARGLRQLLSALIGEAASVRVTDLTVAHAPTPLGGGSCRGVRLPALLAGASPVAPVLGGKAVLGRTCLGVPCDPLACVAPTVHVELTVDRARHRVLEPLLSQILAQYVPAGITVKTSWRVQSPLLANASDDEDILDDLGPGVLGTDSEVGRTLLAGRISASLDDTGLDSGFRLQ